MKIDDLFDKIIYNTNETKEWIVLVLFDDEDTEELIQDIKEYRRKIK